MSPGTLAVMGILRIPLLYPSGGTRKSGTPSLDFDTTKKTPGAGPAHLDDRLLAPYHEELHVHGNLQEYQGAISVGSYSDLLRVTITP